MAQEPREDRPRQPPAARTHVLQHGARRVARVARRRPRDLRDRVGLGLFSLRDHDRHSARQRGERRKARRGDGRAARPLRGTPRGAPSRGTERLGARGRGGTLSHLLAVLSHALLLPRFGRPLQAPRRGDLRGLEAHRRRSLLDLHLPGNQPRRTSQGLRRTTRRNGERLDSEVGGLRRARARGKARGSALGR